MRNTHLAQLAKLAALAVSQSDLDPVAALIRSPIIAINDAQRISLHSNVSQISLAPFSARTAATHRATTEQLEPNQAAQVVSTVSRTRLTISEQHADV